MHSTGVCALQMREEIKGIQRELGLTVIYVTHDQEAALTMSDVVAVIDGRQHLQLWTSPRASLREAFPIRFINANFIERVQLHSLPARRVWRGKGRRCAQPRLSR